MRSSLVQYIWNHTCSGASLITSSSAPLLALDSRNGTSASRAAAASMKSASGRNSPASPVGEMPSGLA